MRLNRRSVGVLTAVSVLALAWSGCTGKKQTELVAGVTSQVQVPRDMRAVAVNVSSALGTVLCNAYPVYDGKVRLPRTLGLLPKGDPGLPVTITVAGYTNDASEPLGAFVGCQPPAVGGKVSDQTGDGARILRRSRQPYVLNRIVYLPMPLRFACYDFDCRSDPNPVCSGPDHPCTCKGGKCVPPDTDVTLLPDFDDSLVYGTTNTCFRPFADTGPDGHTQQLGCLDEGLPPQVVDAKNCVYALPGSSSVPATAEPYDPLVPQQLIDLANSSEPPGQPSGSNLNVRVVWDNLVSEVLDYEGTCPAPGQSSNIPSEGYCTFAYAPQRFQLADGLCHNPLHRITLMTASAGCAPKTQFQPVCDDSVQGPPQPTLSDGGKSTDGGCNVVTPLRPAPSALYVLWDRTSGMRDFFGDRALANVLGLSLGAATFQQTQLAFKYTPGLQSDCSAAPDLNSFVTQLPPSRPDGGSTYDATSGTVGFEVAGVAQSDIATSLSSHGGSSLPPGTSPFYLESALAGAYEALLKQSAKGVNHEAYNRLAVMLFLDRDFANDCGGSHMDAVTTALSSYQSAGIETYVVMLKNADVGGVPPASAIAHAAQLAAPRDQAGNASEPSSFFFNATGDDPSGKHDPGLQELNALTKVVADLGSCVYESEPNISTGAVLSFLDLATRSSVNVAWSGTGCASDSDSTPLWVYDNQHIHVCPHTCGRIVSSLATSQQLAIAAALTADGGTPALTPTVEVTAIEACDPPTPDPKIVEAGAGSLIDAAFTIPDAGAASDAATADASPTDAAGGG